MGFGPALLTSRGPAGQGRGPCSNKWSNDFIMRQCPLHEHEIRPFQDQDNNPTGGSPPDAVLLPSNQCCGKRRRAAESNRNQGEYSSRLRVSEARSCTHRQYPPVRGDGRRPFGCRPFSYMASLPSWERLTTPWWRGMIGFNGRAVRRPGGRGARSVRCRTRSGRPCPSRPGSPGCPASAGVRAPTGGIRLPPRGVRLTLTRFR